jgi:hypothetical protein
MPWIVAEEISKLLKIGGKVGVETHFSFAEHETPWHFFQFNCNGLESLFNERLGFRVIDKGMDNPMIGRFSNDASAYLRGQAITNLYCHSSLIAEKVENNIHIGEHFEWRSALDSVIRETMYPKNTGLSSSV